MGRLAFHFSLFVACVGVVIFGAQAAAAACGDDALGVSRIVEIDASPGLRVGSIQYGHPLPLRPKEVVLTFDDGPLAGSTGRVLDALAEECVKATFFLVGRMARAYPALARRIEAAGHTIAAHSHTHPYHMKNLPVETAKQDIERGFEAISAALGDNAEPAPFFRYPGLSRTAALDAYLVSRGVAIFSADVVGDDWQGIGAEQILDRVLRRLQRRNGGIVLLHDIKPATADMVPALLRQLKAGGYKIVHIVSKRGGVQVALRGGLYEAADAVDAFPAP